MLLASRVLATLAASAWLSFAMAASDPVLLQSTTSTQNSGLLDYLLPKFTAAMGIEVRVVAVGTGQALKNARNGDGDVLLVHAQDAEEQFVARGYGVQRFDLMYNDFVIVGPRHDPAGLSGLDNAVDALRAIAGQAALFASRGDDSGTHKRELGLWRLTGIDSSAASGGWYLETGSGMGATLNTAVGLRAYTLTDRATWIAFGNKTDFAVLVAGDHQLFNQYGVILVNPDRHPHVNAAGGRALIGWLLGRHGQAAIAQYQIAGQQLFFPNAKVR
ncbi:MAG: sulfate transporter [Gammaproteobacteria bacterium]|nr:sulfate transporter [Gammaproteobacteria bacterium]